MYNICNANYCYADDETADEDVDSRANLARLDLVAGNYNRQSTAAATDEFEITYTFNAPVDFTSLTLKKVAGGAADFFDNYKGICLTLTDADGATFGGSGTSCTDQVWGFGLIANDAVADIDFTALTGTQNVVSATLTFDTTNVAGSDLANSPDGTDILSIAQITIDSTFSA